MTLSEILSIFFQHYDGFVSAKQAFLDGYYGQALGGLWINYPGDYHLHCFSTVVRAIIHRHMIVRGSAGMFNVCLFDVHPRNIRWMISRPDHPVLDMLYHCNGMAEMVNALANHPTSRLELDDYQDWRENRNMVIIFDRVIARTRRVW